MTSSSQKWLEIKLTEEILFVEKFLLYLNELEQVSDETVEPANAFNYFLSKVDASQIHTNLFSELCSSYFCQHIDAFIDLFERGMISSRLKDGADLTQVIELSFDDCRYHAPYHYVEQDGGLVKRFISPYMGREYPDQAGIKKSIKRSIRDDRVFTVDALKNSKLQLRRIKMIADSPVDRKGESDEKLD